MKRICILFALFLGLAFAPIIATARCIAPTIQMEETELPANIVQAVLEAVSDQTEFSYNDLSAWYQIGRVTIEEVSEGYRVRIVDNEGSIQIILIEQL